MAAITYNSLTADEADLMSLFLQLPPRKRRIVLKEAEAMFARSGRA